MQFNPHDYQKFAAEHIKNNPIAALFLDMGLGKTVTTLILSTHARVEVHGYTF